MNNSAISKIKAPKNYKLDFSMLDKMPIGFYIVEIIFGENGKGLDIIFRYINDKFEDLLNIKKIDVIGHSFYEVFSKAEKKWIVTYADIALNDKMRVIKNQKSYLKNTFLPHLHSAG